MKRETQRQDKLLTRGKYKLLQAVYTTPEKGSKLWHRVVKSGSLSFCNLAQGIDSENGEGGTQHVSYNSQEDSDNGSEGEETMCDGTRLPQLTIIYERQDANPDACEQPDDGGPLTTTVTASGSYIDERNRRQVPSHTLWYPSDYHFSGYLFDLSIVSNLEDNTNSRLLKCLERDTIDVFGRAPTTDSLSLTKWFKYLFASSCKHQIELVDLPVFTHIPASSPPFECPAPPVTFGRFRVNATCTNPDIRPDLPVPRRCCNSPAGQSATVSFSW